MNHKKRNKSKQKKVNKESKDGGKSKNKLQEEEIYNKDSIINIKNSLDLIEDAKGSIFLLVQKYNFIIYISLNNSIKIFSLIERKNKVEIKNAHKSPIISLNNNENIISYLFLSNSSNNIKIWNIETVDCIFNIEFKTSNNNLISCFLYENSIVIGNAEDNLIIYDFQKGTKIKNIINSHFLIDIIKTYYNNNDNPTFILVNSGMGVKAYNYDQNILYHTFFDGLNNISNFMIYKEKLVTKLLTLNSKGMINIYNFISKQCLQKITLEERVERGMCLWNYSYLVYSSLSKLKIINLKSHIYEKIYVLKGNNRNIAYIEKIINPIYGACLISKAYKEKIIKLWFK